MKVNTFVPKKERDKPAPFVSEIDVPSKSR